MNFMPAARASKFKIKKFIERLEVELFKSVEYHFGNIETKGCYFHYCQCLFKQVFNQALNQRIKKLNF